MAFTKMLTHSGDDDDTNYVGVGFYHIDDTQARHRAIEYGKCIRTEFSTGKYAYRVVFCDRKGAAGTTGWFLR
jgi:hypothetical protein